MNMSQALKEFNDNRLKLHILTVLKGMQSRKKVSTLSNSDITEERSTSVGDFCMPAEVFGIIAECEKRENPGEALLLKAKDLCWSILAMIASCFPDVSPLSCLTVWLEITAARLAVYRPKHCHLLILYLFCSCARARAHTHTLYIVDEYFFFFF